MPTISSYFEDAREKYLAELGFPMQTWKRGGLISPVLHVECDGESVRYGEDKVVVQLAVTALKTDEGAISLQSLRWEETIHEAKPFATGMSEHCLIRRDDFKPVSMKKAVPELYERYRAALEPDYQ